MKRLAISAMIVALAMFFNTTARAANEFGARPAVEHVHPLNELSTPSETWTMEARDSLLTNSWKLVSKLAITRMTAGDTLRLYSSVAADSPYVYLTGIRDTDTTRAPIRIRVKGTDTSYVSIKHRDLEAIYVDTAAAGIISIKAKTGASTITTVAAGDLQTYIAHHYFGKRAGRLTELKVQADPESPAVEFQVRLYRHKVNAIRSPEVGYSVLSDGVVGGVSVYRTQVSKTIVTSANDTSATFAITGVAKAGYAAVITSTGTSNTATYLDVTPDRSNWKQTTAIDSYNATGVTGTVVRSRSIAVDSLYGQPWARVIVNGKGSAGDTSTMTVFFTVHRPVAPDIYVEKLNEFCPKFSYVAVYARAIGANGRVYVRLKGEDQ